LLLQDDLDIEVVGASTEGSSSRWMARANGLKPIRSSRSQVSSTGPKQPASGSPLAAVASLPFSSEDLQLQPPPSRTGSTLATNPAELMRLGMLMAVTMTLHNLPEGFAVAFSAYTEMGLIMALAIAVHNIPEGIIVAAPIYAATGSRLRAIGMATASGLSEPLGAFIALAFVQPFVGNVRSSLDYVLAFVGGVMISVCLLELWPEARKCRDDKRMMQGIMLGSLVMGWTLYVGV
jgi:ZIP family zinc transporter